MLMHHKVAGGEIGERVELFAVRRALGRRFFAPVAARHDLPLGEHREFEVGIFHAGGQAAVGDENLPRLGQRRAREGEQRVHLLRVQQLLENFAAPPAAAEHQTAEAAGRVVLQVLHRRIQAPAVAGELLGDDAVQRLRRQAFGVLRGQKRVKIRRAAPGEAARQILQALRKIAQLARERPVLQKRVELQAQILRARLFRAAQIPVVAEKYERVLRDIVRRRGQLRVNERQITVSGRERQPRLQLFAVSLQRFDERLVGRFAAALPRDERR